MTTFLKVCGIRLGACAHMHWRWGSLLTVVSYSVPHAEPDGERIELAYLQYCSME